MASSHPLTIKARLHCRHPPTPFTDYDPNAGPAASQEIGANTEIWGPKEFVSTEIRKWGARQTNRKEWTEQGNLVYCPVNWQFQNIHLTIGACNAAPILSALSVSDVPHSLYYISDITSLFSLNRMKIFTSPCLA